MRGTRDFSLIKKHNTVIIKTMRFCYKNRQMSMRQNEKSKQKPQITWEFKISLKNENENQRKMGLRSKWS